MTDPTSPTDPVDPTDPWRPTAPGASTFPEASPGPGASPYRPGYQADPQPYAVTPAPPTYGQAAGETGGPAVPAYGMPVDQASAPHGELAGWGARVASSLLDSLVALPGLVLMMIGIGIATANFATDSSYADGVQTTTLSSDGGNSTMIAVGFGLAALGWLLSIAMELWNRVVKGGRGQTWGKKIMGLWMIKEDTGQPTGAGTAFLRELAHVVDGAILDIGYLWPLWDERKQTLGDKICGTLVVKR